MLATADDIQINFSSESTYDAEMSFVQLRGLLAQCARKFKDEPTLLRVNYPVMIVGDLHGQYKDLLRILGLSSSKTVDVAKDIKRYIFLGDYVDRGPDAIPCLITLMQLKVKHPKSYNLLRGNHETETINEKYGFKSEINRRYTKNFEQKILFREFNDMFAWIPIAALISNRILCMHGGISPRLNSLADIERIERPLLNVFSVPLAGNLMWSDPAHIETNYSFNTVRGVSCFFSEKAVIDTCNRLNLDFIVRGHQVMNNGYWFFAGTKMITVFSAPRYSADSKGAVMVINKNKEFGFVFLAPTEKLSTEKAFKDKFDYLDRLQYGEDLNFCKNADKSVDTQGEFSRSMSSRVDGDDSRNDGTDNKRSKKNGPIKETNKRGNSKRKSRR
ncbi:unnamed protein product [Bursaphelenchus okinawaensis]|uniref:Serine/threonine-protein phosphatase n=1 Tax=Bursaphelenchus okinawaensis TaxID=465554 RepID=A0A811KYC5_9BILA|nr:unnamed protein product [Bursaphelenchus okinawaensis]CAG9114522.1 unnamed protein product [Bursaphelenchus okinawaensis]